MNKKSQKIKVIFATGNLHKVREIHSIVKNYPITIKQINLKGYEIQAINLEDIAKNSVIWAIKQSRDATFVEDTGLYIEALKGFPGAYASYVNKTIGAKGILQLLKQVKNRRALFKSVIAFCVPYKKPICFNGVVYGKISLKERGFHGFGFDLIFEPKNCGSKTFGEMMIDEKNMYSHRAIASRKFFEWLLNNFKYYNTTI